MSGCTGDATEMAGQSSSPLEYLEKRGMRVLCRSQDWICHPTLSHTRHVSRNQCHRYLALDGSERDPGHMARNSLWKAAPSSTGTVWERQIVQVTVEGRWENLWY